MCAPLEEKSESTGKSKSASVADSANLLCFLCAYNVPGPRMARPALSGAHRLGGRREHDPRTKPVCGEQWEGAPRPGTAPSQAQRHAARHIRCTG